MLMALAWFWLPSSEEELQLMKFWSRYPFQKRVCHGVSGAMCTTQPEGDEPTNFFQLLADQFTNITINVGAIAVRHSLG